MSVSTGKLFESRRVPAKDGIRASTEKLSEQVRKNGRINGTTEKLLNPGEYRQKMKSVWVPKNHPDQYEKNGWMSVSTGTLFESRRVRAKDGIRASTKKHSGPVRKNGRMCVSTGTLLNPGEYRQKVESVLVPKNCLDQFRKMVESVWVPEHCWIRATTGKRWNSCEYRITVRTSTEKW